MNTKEHLKNLGKGLLKGTLISGALVATAAVSPGLAVGALGVLAAKHDPQLRKSFQAGLKKWKQQSGQNLSLKAKLLRFRNAVSAGLRTMDNSRQVNYVIPQFLQKKQKNNR